MNSMARVNGRAAKRRNRSRARTRRPGQDLHMEVDHSAHSNEIVGCPAKVGDKPGYPYFEAICWSKYTLVK